MLALESVGQKGSVLPVAQSKIPNTGKGKVPPAERIKNSFKKLAIASEDLNIALKELNSVISSVEQGLKAFHPPVATWFRLAGGEHEPSGYYWHRDIGYTQIGKEWRITLREVSGDHQDEDDIETWRFRDAPQWLQIESVGKIPDLLDEIIERTRDTTAKLRAKTEEARLYASAFSEAISEQNPDVL